MEWATPQFKRGEVDRAGRTYADLMTRDDWSDDDVMTWYTSLNIINNWRSAHSFPLNTFQVGLRRKARRFESNPVVAQRTKRLWSIWHKLDRFPTMQLSQMQDIAGCRVILSNAQSVRAITQEYRTGALKHSKKITDYIEKPRSSGYRGVHIIWKYFSDRREIYNGLQIEMQIRTVLQHAWATSVETMGTLTQQALKSSLGDADWLRFFALMGTVVAHRENCPSVPGTPSDPRDLVEELQDYNGRVNALARFSTIRNALQYVEEQTDQDAHFFLMEMTTNHLKITGYPAAHHQEAQADYLEVEKRIERDKDSDAVLVSVDSIASLRRAYPNYFLDTGVFREMLEGVLAGDLAAPVSVPQ